MNRSLLPVSIIVVFFCAPVAWASIFGDVRGTVADLFFLDHDQRDTLSTGLAVSLPAHSYISGNVRYGSGFLDGDGPQHLPGHTTFNLSIGKDFGEYWKIALQTVNLTNKRFLPDNSNTFGGTHSSEPRQIYVEVRYRFHY